MNNQNYHQQQAGNMGMNQQHYQQQGYQQQPYQGQPPQGGYQSPVGQFAMDDEDLDLNGTIQNDGEEFVLFPAGEYQFYVTKYETAEYQDTKVQPPKARKKVIVHLQIEHEGQKKTVQEHIPLKKNMEWKFCSLFKAIGDRKKDQLLVMDWANIAGKSGKCVIKIDTYNNRQSNKVDKYIDPNEPPKEAPQGYQQAPMQTQMQQPSFQQPAQQPAQGFQPQATHQAPPQNFNQAPPQQAVQGTPPPAEDDGSWA